MEEEKKEDKPVNAHLPTNDEFKTALTSDDMPTRLQALDAWQMMQADREQLQAQMDAERKRAELAEAKVQKLNEDRAALLRRIPIETDRNNPLMVNMPFKQVDNSVAPSLDDLINRGREKLAEMRKGVNRNER